MAPSLPDPCESGQEFLVLLSLLSLLHQSFVAKDVPQPLPEA